MKNSILTINVGSSGIKIALFEMTELLPQLFAVEVKKKEGLKAGDLITAVFKKHKYFHSVKVVVHRIVNGLKRTKPERITPELLAELNSFSSYEPEHLPEEIALIEILGKRYPNSLQVACFDTSFHTTMPEVAKRLAIPRRFSEKGLQRYGFHGLSYNYLMEELQRKKQTESASGRTILAHLGSGASLAAVKDGKSMDTSMGFTSSSGLPMSSRAGDLDPGVVFYLQHSEKLTLKEVIHLVNYESGLFGVSETSSDMRELLNRKDADQRAEEAIELFCYQVKKGIGSYAAVLGGLDTVVFSGGIGQNAPEIRGRICFGLQFFGIELDPAKNSGNEAIISAEHSRVTVHVINTNEELMMARLAYTFVKGYE